MKKAENWTSLSKREEELLTEAVFQKDDDIGLDTDYERVLINEDTGQVIFKKDGILVFAYKE